jgi:hypothetical protein
VLVTLTRLALIVTQCSRTTLSSGGRESAGEIWRLPFRNPLRQASGRFHRSAKCSWPSVSPRSGRYFKLRIIAKVPSLSELAEFVFAEPLFAACTDERRNLEGREAGRLQTVEVKCCSSSAELSLDRDRVLRAVSSRLLASCFLAFTGERPFERLLKLSADCQQHLCPAFNLSAFDRRYVALADTAPLCKFMPA